MSLDSYTIGIDQGKSRDICVEDRHMHPTAEYPDGSWLHTVAGNVEVATGYYATLHPDKPSPYFHKGPPFVMVDFNTNWPWENKA